MVLRKTLESSLDFREIKPVNPKGNQSWIFIGRTDAEAETPVLWLPDAKNWLIWKDPDAGKDWRQEEKGMTEDEMFGWHHQLPEFTQTRVHKSRWYHPTISFSVAPFSSCTQSFPASGSFPMSQFFLHQVAKVLEFQVQHQSFQWIFRTDFLWD